MSGRAAGAARTAVLLSLGLVLATTLASGGASAAGNVEVTAEIDGRPLSKGTETHPIRLDPKRESVLSVEVVNRGREAIAVRTVRLEGRVVGLTFFAYDTAVGLSVPAGGQGSRRFTLDLAGLDGQATGLVPGAVKLLDSDRHEIASQDGVVDVRGSLRSVYGLFGLGVAILTGVGFVACLLGLARHRLHPNRWRRAMRFLTPGMGLGLLLNFTLSATRVFVPAVGRWLTIVVVSSAVLFVLGYLTPAPDLRTDEDLEDEEEELAALRSGSPALALAGSPAAAELASPMAGTLASPPIGELGPRPPPELGPFVPTQLPGPTWAPPGPAPLGEPNASPTIVPAELDAPAEAAPATVTVGEMSEDRFETVRQPAPVTVGADLADPPAVSDAEESGMPTTVTQIVPLDPDEGWPVPGPASRPTVVPEP